MTISTGRNARNVPAAVASPRPANRYWTSGQQCPQTAADRACGDLVGVGEPEREDDGREALQDVHRGRRGREPACVLLEQDVGVALADVAPDAVERVAVARQDGDQIRGRQRSARVADEGPAEDGHAHQDAPSDPPVTGIGRSAHGSICWDERGDTGACIDTDPSGSGDLLRNRPFRYLLGGHAVSSLGDWVATFGLMLFVRDLTRGSSIEGLAISGILGFRILPALIAAPIASSITDRFDRRRTMIAADICRAALIAAVPFTPNLGAVYGIAFVLEGVEPRVPSGARRDGPEDGAAATSSPAPTG